MLFRECLQRELYESANTTFILLIIKARGTYSYRWILQGYV
jgi:hypothetical protein